MLGSVGNDNYLYKIIKSFESCGVNYLLQIIPNIRNLDLQAKNVANRILINIWSSRQIWIDHVNFNSTLSYDRTGNGQDEIGKFSWLNTP